MTLHSLETQLQALLAPSSRLQAPGSRPGHSSWLTQSHHQIYLRSKEIMLSEIYAANCVFELLSGLSGVKSLTLTSDTFQCLYFSTPKLEVLDIPMVFCAHLEDEDLTIRYSLFLVMLVSLFSLLR
ncbi:hypothetical protein P8452_31628 [Trifolium repens]|nr:hypothetical protein P8452_31628 [Trifolium repens]